MVLKNYNGFDHKQRMTGSKIVDKAIEDGLVPPPLRCERCGQAEGLLVYHVEDYSPERILDNLEALCGRCHDMIHRARPVEKQEAYWADVRSGKMGAPWGKPKVWLVRQG